MTARRDFLQIKNIETAKLFDALFGVLGR
jgi:hypothetical protein